MAKHVLIIYNDAAASQIKTTDWIGKIVEELNKRDQYMLSFFPTTEETQLQDIIKLIVPPLDFVIAAGGDGTIRFALGALAMARSDIPVAVFPLGTANVFARNIGVIDGGMFADNLEHAYDYLNDAVPVPVDLGIMNGEYFCCFAGVGPVSDAMMKPERLEKSKFKIFAYVKALLASIARPSRYFKITTAGETKIVQASGVFFVEVEDLGINKDNNLDLLSDGLLNMHILNPVRLKDYVALAVRYIKGEAEYVPELVAQVSGAYVEALPQTGFPSTFQKWFAKLYGYLATRSAVEPDLTSELPCMLDGDACGKTPMHIEVAPHAVKVLVPRARVALKDAGELKRAS